MLPKHPAFPAAESVPAGVVVAELSLVPMLDDFVALVVEFVHRVHVLDELVYFSGSFVPTEGSGISN